VKSKRAIKACADWLAACLRMGWPREDLDRLEAMWWRWHHDNGHPISEPRDDT
jgi:hypothetical protein